MRKLSKPFSEVDIYRADTRQRLPLPYTEAGVAAGFPSPAEDYLEQTLDLNSLIKNPAATFYGKVRGNSMQNAGMQNGDIIVIDRSLSLRNDCIAVCCTDGAFTVKNVRLTNDVCWLYPANNEFEPIRVTAENDFMIWGIVTYVVAKKY